MVELDDLRSVAGIAPAVPTLDLPYYIDRPDLKSLRNSLEVSHLAKQLHSNLKPHFYM